MTKKTGIFLASIVAIMSASCSSKGEQAEVTEEAAQIEAAHIDGARDCPRIHQQALQRQPRAAAPACGIRFAQIEI